MYGDFSRLNFDRAKSYTAAWSQQGRMQLDSDFNEQTAILLDYMRTLAIDFMGPAGGNTDPPAGFEVSLTNSDVSLSTGHYYVAGIRCQNPASNIDGTPMPTTYTAKQLDITSDDKTYLVYLRVWERSVNFLQDRALLEPALGPTSPDTTIRSQVVWSPAIIHNPQTWKDAALTEVDYAAVDSLFATNEPPTEEGPR